MFFNCPIHDKHADSGKPLLTVDT